MALVGCAGDRLPVAAACPVTVPRVDSVIARPCDRPVDLPDSADPADVRRLWAADRAHLLDCAGRAVARSTIITHLRTDL
ncbi:hypothetical protein ABTM06_19840, partial [Acinetobacter baumannii]